MSVACTGARGGSRRAALALGGLCLASPLLAVTLLACTCDPAPSRPSTETCASPAGLVATSVRVFRHGGAELTDGSVPPVFFGAQGGSHWGFDLLVAAEGASDCVEVSLELRDRTSAGPLLGSFSGGVRARLVTDGVRSSQIVVFPTSTPMAPVVVIARAYGAVTNVTLCPEGTRCVLGDAGVAADAP